jgi:hypothetical protein
MEVFLERHLPAAGLPPGNSGRLHRFINVPSDPAHCIEAIPMRQTIPAVDHSPEG